MNDTLDNAKNANGSTPSNQPPKDPYHQIEFDEFLKQIGDGNISNWSIIAEALGVSKATIIRWKQHPLAKDAIRTAIGKSLADMEKAGESDWKMHREKLKMLGVKDKSTIEHEVGEGVEELLDRIETNYGDLAKNARQTITGQVLATDAPVQNQG